MRVLLVYSNRTRDLILAPPIGLSYVASATRRAGHTVRFLDLLTVADPDAALDTALREFAPDVVGISVRNIDNVVCQRLQSHLGELARFITTIRRATGGRVPIVLGGPAISILGSTVLAHVDADYAVRGEGEITFPALLAALAAGRDPGSIPGVCTRDPGRTHDSLPARLPAFGASGMQDWIDWKKYARRGGTFAIQTKRGCPMTCSYCSYPDIEGQKLRRRDPADVVDEIEAVQRMLAPRAFEFVDSTFNLPESHALAICEEIVRRRVKVNLTTMGINPRATSAQLFALMKRAGFNSMMITPESGSDTMLTSLDKGFDMRDVERTAQLADASGLHSTWFFMLGGPGETRVTVNETMAFVERALAGPRFLSVFMTGIRMLPGTRLAAAHAAPGADLAQPAFFFSSLVSEAWMLARINAVIYRQSNVVHAAEEGSSMQERTLHRVLHWLGVAPPYWRFLPKLLGFPPLHAMRRRNPSVGSLRTA
ncbi:MAG: radical SAM protein [Pseudomonadota bacterium]|mgnify:CR=1 FL=1